MFDLLHRKHNRKCLEDYYYFMQMSKFYASLEWHTLTLWYARQAADAIYRMK